MKRLIALLWLFLAGFTAQAETPEWIWRCNDPKPGEVSFFRRTFACNFKPQKAELICTGDDEFTLFLNGKSIASSADFRKPVTVDVSSEIQNGNNVLAARVKNNSGPAGFLLKLELRTENNFPHFILSDANWLSTAKEESGWEQPAFAAADWTPVATLGKSGAPPWGQVLEKPTATAAESLTVLPGFKAELVKSADHHEGSWICMTMDDKGRFIISPEKNEAPLLRVTVSKSGRVEKTESIAPRMHAAMGLCYAFGSLYLNGHGPKGVGLYRLTDKNHNDQFDDEEIVLLKNFDGDNEHGYHAVALGPDKKIYVMNGNHTKVPPDIAPDSPHRNYQEDLLLPRMWDANGHAKGIYAPGGYVLRADPDGKKWELFCGGFRNTYDFDFNRDGEMFTFDSDMEWDIGAPWYRPTRINHVVSGGEYGWRSGTGKWPVYYHDSLPGNLDIGLSSPTGVKFGTKSKFPPKYRDALFACDWAYGKIFAVHLKPEGASYSGTFETFVSGKPLNVVDLEFGRDGAMYFIIGGWKTQSGLYRVSYDGAPQKEQAPSALEKRARLFAAKQRSLRRKLESFHGKRNPAAVEFAWPYLGVPDRWLRYAARIAIESQDVLFWQRRALEETNSEAAVNALLALSRCGDKGLRGEIAVRLCETLLRCETEDQQLEALRALEVCFTRMGRPAEDISSRARNTLASLFPARSENLNRELCQLLVYLDDSNVVSKTLALMEAAPTQQEQMHYAFVLRNATSGWSMAQRKAYFTWFNKALAEYKGGNSFEKFLLNIRAEAAGKPSAAERAELASIIDLKPAGRIEPLPLRQFVKEWKLEDFLADFDQIGKGRSFVKGKTAFAAAQCVLCHRVGAEGGSIGPELTGVSGRFNRRDLLDNILSPSKIISDRYQSFTITRKDGEELSGGVVEENDDKVVVMIDPLNAKTVEVRKADIQSRIVSKLSAMPEGLLNVLTRTEILDLLAFLESDGKSNAPPFVAAK